MDELEDLNQPFPKEWLKYENMPPNAETVYALTHPGEVKKFNTLAEMLEDLDRDDDSDEAV